MSVTRILAVCAVSIGVVALAGCSEDKKQCPACGAGFACDPATGQCVPAVTSGCPAGGCGANATCRQDNVCVCVAGFADCNGNLSGAGDGCECQGLCNGTICGGAGTCNPGTPNACGQSGSYCNAGACAPCPAGKFNCDGMNDCEAATACGSASCSPSTPNACGKNQYCNGTMCATCPAGKYNCDGVNDCESATPCGCDPAKANDCGGSDQYCGANRTCEPCPASVYNCDGVDQCESSSSCNTPSGPCEKECTDFNETHCVKNPAANNRCEECLSTTDCTNNPRAMGPICDTSDLAGTGFSFCICKTEADCVTSTTGKLCRATEGVPNPNLKQCTCDTDADCPGEYSICEGSLFKLCRKRCENSDYCYRNGVQGWCDTATGKCSYPDF